MSAPTQCVPTPRFDTAILCHHCLTLHFYLESPGGLATLPACTNPDCPGLSGGKPAHGVTTCGECEENEWWTFWICWCCNRANVFSAVRASNVHGELVWSCSACAYVKDGACEIVWKKNGEVSMWNWDVGAVDIEALRAKFWGGRRRGGGSGDEMGRGSE